MYYTNAYDRRYYFLPCGQDRRLRARRVARQRAAVRLLQAAEARRREAEEQAAEREGAAARARQKLLKQEEANRTAIEVYQDLFLDRYESFSGLRDRSRYLSRGGGNGILTVCGNF